MSRCTDTTQSLTPGGCFASCPTPFTQAGVANPFLAYQEILVLAVITQTLDSPELQPVGPVGRREGEREGEEFPWKECGSTRQWVGQAGVKLGIWEQRECICPVDVALEREIKRNGRGNLERSTS